MAKKCFLCFSKKSDSDFIYEFNKKPNGETDFGIPSSKYHRTIHKCKLCGVYYNLNEFLLDDLYKSSYNEATYKNKILENFERIMSLDAAKSDNKSRVKRIADFFHKQSISLKSSSVLDVGSGLCVFLAEIKKYGPYTVCIDPDPLSAQHALNNVKVDRSFYGSLENFESKIKFDLITFNKVLEHIRNPIQTLITVQKFLKKGGYIYIELPDGDNALKNGKIFDREEFYIEHYTIFNSKSIKYMAKESKLFCTTINQIHEPSDKYSIYSFLKKEL